MIDRLPPRRLPRDYWQRHVASLDVETDWAEIYGIAVEHEFPWDMEQSLSLALFRTFAVPGIGVLLARTGEFTQRTQKRYDDTAIVLQEVGDFVGGQSTDRTGVRRLNEMHAGYDIPNDQMLYVLATFLVIPHRWVNRFGYRRWTDQEVLAATKYWQRIGELMGIRDIPASYEEFAVYLDTYEAENFRFSPGGREVADATLHLMASWYPAFLRGVITQVTYTLLDEHLRKALRYPAAAPLIAHCLNLGFAARKALLSRLPARRARRRPTDSSHMRLYPQGWDIATVGTFPRGAAASSPQVGDAAVR